MPGLNFSGPNLATVAYAEVDGAAGASTTMNSGVTTTRTALGTYVVILPTNLAQVEASDLIFVQLNEPSNVMKTASVDNSLSQTKTITVWSTSGSTPTNLDSSFSILVLRSTLNPPAGSPY